MIDDEKQADAGNCSPAENTNDAVNLHRAWVDGESDVFLEYGKYRNRTVRISELKAGENALSWCEKTQQLKYCKVLNVLTKESQPTFYLYCEGFSKLIADTRAVEVNANLPFFVVGQGWTTYADVKVGDKIKAFDRDAFRTSIYDAVEILQNKELTVVGKKRSGVSKTLYSVEVEDFHSYCLGEIGAWVHDGNGIEALPLSVATTAALAACFGGISRIGGCSGSESIVANDYDNPIEISWVSPSSHLLSRDEETGTLKKNTALHRVFHEALHRAYIYYKHNGEKRFSILPYGQDILLKGQGWTNVTDLQPGDIFESGPDNHTVLTSIELEPGGELEMSHFYAFVMEGAVNYCIGDDSELCLRGFEFDE